MPMMLFNPPSPHADPVSGAGNVNDQNLQGNNPCGGCVCVPRHYQINPVAKAAQDGYSAAYMGTHVLTRSLAAYRTDRQEKCHWDVKVDTSGWGMLVQTFLFSIGPIGWTLVYADSITGWLLRAAGQSYLLSGQQDVASYSLHAPGRAISFFNCRSPTTFYMDPTYSNMNLFSNFPDSVEVKPFWP